MQFSLASLVYGHRGRALAPPLSATFESGQIVAILGRNGSGKSTLLNTMAALLKPISGEVRISHGHNDGSPEERPLVVHQMSVQERARWVSILLPTAETPPLIVQELVSLGRLPHGNRPLGASNLGENISSSSNLGENSSGSLHIGENSSGSLHLGESISSSSNLGESISSSLYLGENSSGSLHPVEQALELCGISHWAERKVQTLSSGQRQRVMLARAVAQDTPIMLLDEPTNFLDVEATDEMFQLLSYLAQQGKIIIVATHQRDWAQRHAHQVLWL